MERSILNIAATMLVLFFVSAGTAGAIVNVNYQVLKGTIASNGAFTPGTAAVNNAGFLGFVCANAECSSVSGSLWGGASQSTGSDNKIMLQYPTTLISPYGYMVWVHKDGYIPWTYEANWYGTGTAQGTYTKYLSKKEGCHAHIDDFVVINDAKPNIPLQVYVDASLDATTYSALMCNTDNYVPQELRDDLSADTRVTLTIYDSYGHAVFSRSSDISLYCSTAKRVEFTWTPTEAGSYRAVARTDVIDSKCSSGMPEQTSKDFTVIADEPDQTCYTLLNNLQISNPYPKVGDVFDIEFTKLSNHAADTLLTPVTTDIKMRVVRDATGDVMASESQTLTANPDSYNPVWIGYTLDTAGFPAGSYTIIVDGTTSDSMCDGLEILDETVVLGFYLDHARECTPGEDETVACGTDVGQCSFGQKTRICDSDGFWGDYGSCTGGIGPSEEICDNLDNDCDYLVDEGNVCGECTPGDTETMSCGSNVGECEYGSQTRECLDNGIGGGTWGDYGSCTGGVLPSDEICDGLDNDCDYLVDEDGVCGECTPGQTQTRDCGSNVGECEYGSQKRECLDNGIGGGTWGDYGSCTGGIGPSEEICDNLDNDCDGQVDEDNVCGECTPGETQAKSCGSNVGVCEYGSQTRECLDNGIGGGTWGDYGSCTGGVLPSDEICDGLDNDCDNMVDEGGVCAPMITGIPDVTFAEDSCSTLDLDDYVTDPDNSADELDWTVSGNTLVDIDIDPLSHIATFCSAQDWNGREYVLFSVWDPDRSSDSDNVVVTVIPADDAPVISDIPDILFPMNSCASLDLDSYVDDPDNDDSELDWTVSGNINVDINIDPVTHIAMFCSSDDWHGKEHVVFTVVDPDRLSDSDDAMVTVPGPEGNLSVKVIYPNGGEILRGNTIIRWLAVSTHDCSGAEDIMIEYSPDAGRSWHLIADDEENDGAYGWDTTGVPDQATYLIKVTATDCAESAYDISDGIFTINNHGAIHEEEEKNIYGLYISQILFVNPFGDLPRPGDELDVRVYISNSGDENLDDLRISAYLPDFGERSNSVRLDLDKGMAARKDLYLWLPDYAQPGEYAVRIVMQNTRVKRVRHRYITVS